MISIIAAIGKNNELGKNGAMPWDIKEDLVYFKKVTMGSTMIMGRKTFESLPGILPGRPHVVLTRDKNYINKNIQVIRDLSEINNFENPFIIGGGQIYKETINQVDKLYITRIDKTFDADTFFPDIDANQFKLVSTSEKIHSEKENLQFVFEVYERV